MSGVAGPRFLAIEGLGKRFGDARVLEGVSLGVAEGETLALLGPSGSGKTTLLRLVAGFEAPDAGSIAVAGAEVTALPPARRNVGMVFQHFALFPHLTVDENVAFGLESRGVARSDRARRVETALALVDLAGFGGRQVPELSGGQQQRVALARALAPEPRVLLLDEPLSNLDPALRERTRRQIRETIARVGITALWVTHEQEEAFDVGDRVAVLNRGRLEQVGTPEELYLEPASRFVAGFVGRASVVAGTLGDGDRVRLGPEPAAVSWPAAAAAGLAPGDPVEAVLRPEGLALVAAGTAGAVAGRVASRRYAGAQTFYAVTLDGGVEVEVAGGPDDAREGEAVAVAPRPGGPAPRVFAAGGGEA